MMSCSSSATRTPRYDFVLNQGADLTVPILLTDASSKAVDLSGYSVQMQLRTSVSAAQAVDTLTTQNGRIRLEATSGKLSLFFPNSITEKFPAQTLVYDIEITSAGGQITRIVEGRIKVSAEVTRVTENS